MKNNYQLICEILKTQPEHYHNTCPKCGDIEQCRCLKKFHNENNFNKTHNTCKKCQLKRLIRLYDRRGDIELAKEAREELKSLKQV